MPKGIFLRTEECRRKISESLKGRRLSEKHKENIRKCQIGKKHLEKTKEKIREGCKGINKGQKNGMWGKKHSKEARQKITKNHADFSMEKHPNWQGGKSFEPYALEFNNQLKEEIRKRDNCQCQFCGISENGRIHDIHHINYIKKDCRPRNLNALCRGCNVRVNTNKEKWQFLFETLQEIRGI